MKRHPYIAKAAKRLLDAEMHQWLRIRTNPILKRLGLPLIS